MENEKINLPIHFEKIQSFNVNDDRFIKCKVWIAHTGVNKNNWIFTKDSLQSAIPSLTNIPIVAFVQKNNNSEDDFSDHREVLEIDKGKFKISYKGKAIGIVTSENNAQFETKVCDDGIEREFLTCEALLWTKFDDSIEIFMRDECKDQSMEIDNYKGKFNKYSQFECSEFRFTGLCCLGCGVEPAMYSACVDINFTLDEIKTKLEQFNNYISKQSQTSNDNDINNDDMKGGEKLTTETIEAILAEFNVTSEELGEYANDISEDNFRSLVSEFAASRDKSDNTEPTATAELKATFSTYNQKYELLIGALPRKEERNDDGVLTYCLEYWVSDFDDNYVYVSKAEYIDDKWNYTKGRFTYSISDTNEVSITSEFEKMIVKWVTPEEDAEIDKARAAFEKIAEFEANVAEFERLKQFEKDTKAEEFKNATTAIFSKFDESLNDVEGYELLKASFSDMSLEAIEEKCYAMLGKKNANFSVQDHNTPTPNVVNLGVDHSNDEPEDDGYGGLLSRKYNN